MRNGKKVLGFLGAFVFGLVMATTTLSAMGYIDWRGTPEVVNTMSNLDKLEVRILELKAQNEKDTFDMESYQTQLLDHIKGLDTLILNRDISINELRDQVIERDAMIEELKVLVKKLDDVEESAYLDVVRINARVEELLEVSK